MSSKEKELLQQLEALQKELDTLKVKQSKPREKPARKAGRFTCFNCRQPGHRFRECPEPLKERLKHKRTQPFRRRDGKTNTRSQESQVDEQLNC